jgi:hypothetical protein
VTPSKYLIVTGLLLVLAGCATNSRITNAPATTGDIEPFSIILKIALLSFQNGEMFYLSNSRKTTSIATNSLKFYPHIVLKIQ